jgi:hypothetical protein
VLATAAVGRTAEAQADAVARAAVEAAQPTDDGPEVNDQILQNMLGNLYVRYSSLSEFVEVGEGGFATVHKALYRHPNGMTQIVAVKQLLASRVAEREDLKDFIAVRRRSRAPRLLYSA